MTDDHTLKGDNWCIARRMKASSSFADVHEKGGLNVDIVPKLSPTVIVW